MSGNNRKIFHNSNFSNYQKYGIWCGYSTIVLIIMPLRLYFIDEITKQLKIVAKMSAHHEAQYNSIWMGAK